MERKKAAETLTRLTSTHAGSTPHSLKLPSQKLCPDASGSRERKSRYCCATKNCVASIWFDAPGVVASPKTVILKAGVTETPPVAPGSVTNQRPKKVLP